LEPGASRQEQIELPMDLTFDIELRKAGEEQDKAA
jgi:hypothetical protein